MKNKLSVIILSWNTKDFLRDCLLSIIREGRALKENIEVIVVDNGSKDGSVEMVKKAFPKVVLVENKKNLGFSKGNNIGLKKARGDFLMLLNSDTILENDSLKELLQFIKQRKKTACSPLLLLPNKTPQVDYYMKFPNLFQIFFYHNPILRSMVLKTPFLKGLICFSAKRTVFEVDQLPGAAFLASRETWRKVGFLDEDYSFLFEDVDWCFRARKKGVKLFVVPDSKVIHIGGASWKKRLKEDTLGFYKHYFSSLLLFVKKNYSKTSLLTFRFSLFFNFLILGICYFPFFPQKGIGKLILSIYCLFNNRKPQDLW